MKQRSLQLLIVEDEALVAMLLEDMLIELGHHVIGPVGTPGQAFAAIDGIELDGALLDVNLGGGARSYGIADALHARRVPFAFVSGYGTTGVDSRYDGVAVLQKPFGSAELRNLISRVFE